MRLRVLVLVLCLSGCACLHYEKADAQMTACFVGDVKIVAREPTLFNSASITLRGGSLSATAGNLLGMALSGLFAYLAL